MYSFLQTPHQSFEVFFGPSTSLTYQIRDFALNDWTKDAMESFLHVSQPGMQLFFNVSFLTPRCLKLLLLQIDL